MDRSEIRKDIESQYQSCLYEMSAANEKMKQYQETKLKLQGATEMLDILDKYEQKADKQVESSVMQDGQEFLAEHT